MKEIVRDERYYHGILYLKEREHGMMPMRLNEAQLDCYRVSEARIIRAMCSAGVSLEMETDARWVRLKMYVTDLSRNFANMTAIIDGMRQPVVSIPLQEPGYFEAEFPLPGGLHRLSIYLPCLLGEELCDLTCDAEMTVMRPVPRREKLYLALGDSITQGMEAADPTRVYPTQVALNLDMELINQGVCGGTYLPGVIQDNGLKPSLITVALGTNDRNLVPTREAFLSNLEAFLTRLEQMYPKVPTVLILPPWSTQETDTGKFATLAEIRQMIRDVAKKHPHFKVVDGKALVPAGDTYFHDGTHPNDAGFQVYASSLLRQFLIQFGSLNF